MKKNLLNGLLVLAVASVGVGTFSSCKDDNGDEMSIVESKVSKLEQEVADLKNCRKECEAARQALETKLMGYIQELKDKDVEQDGRLAALEGRINQAELDIVNLTASIEALDNRIKELEAFKKSFDDLNLTAEAISNFMAAHDAATNEVIQGIQDNITSIKNNYATKEELATAVNNINTEITNIKNDINVKYEDLSEKAKKGIEALTWIETNKARLDALEEADKKIKDDIAKNAADINVNTTNIANNATAIEDLKTRVSNLETKLTSLETLVGDHTALITALQGDVTTINTKLQKLDADITNLQNQIDANKQAIETLRNDMNQMFNIVTERLNKLVTGIINQATTNPVFGYMNLPINIRTNMLLTYFGTAQNTAEFPTVSSIAEYDNEQRITSDDMRMLQESGNFGKIKYNSGDVLMDTEDGNAGMVFMTINPNNVDFTGMNVSLVNSQDEECGMKLKNIQKSDKVLSFGYTRAANNGFYQAQATVDPSHVNEIAVKIEPGMKEAFKNALQDKGKKDFAQLVKALYLQFSEILPAEGLKASWTAPDGNGNQKEYAVYSNYDLAATAVAPLSFKFMEGQSIDHELPTINPLTGFEFDKSQFTFDIDVPPFHINDIDVNVELGDITINEVGGIIVKIEVPKKVDSEGNVIETEIKEYDLSQDINDVLASVQQDINNTIGQWNDQIESQFKDALTKLKDDIQTQVDNMMNDVMGQIDENLGNLIDQINKQVNDAVGGYFNDANKIIEKYNKVANKINDMLKHPNDYLQNMMCYKGTDGDFHHVSTTPTMPSPFVLAGGNAITLYLTSYTGEIIAPAFKKFVGVTNVWNNATGKDARKDGDVECKSLLVKANSQNSMNSPVTGKQHAVAFNADKAGYTYEIVYSALDYRGFTSTRKYYITVK